MVPFIHVFIEIATKGYDLEKTTVDIDAEIDETETRLKRLKQKRVDTRKQTEVVHAREKEVTANVQDIRSKLQAVDKALTELNSE